MQSTAAISMDWELRMSRTEALTTTMHTRVLTITTQQITTVTLTRQHPSLTPADRCQPTTGTKTGSQSHDMLTAPSSGAQMKNCI